LIRVYQTLGGGWEVMRSGGATGPTVVEVKTPEPDPLALPEPPGEKPGPKLP
jgi:hypothetical protein